MFRLQEWASFALECPDGQVIDLGTSDDESMSSMTYLVVSEVDEIEPMVMELDEDELEQPMEEDPEPEDFGKFRGSLLPPADAGSNYAKLARECHTTGTLFAVPEAPYARGLVAAEEGNNLEDRTVIKRAFLYFKTYKGLLVDLIYSFHERDDSKQFFQSRTAKDAFRVIEAELNFFYDVLYTKAAVIHCPTGYLFRAISIGSVVSAFASFYVLDKHDFHEYDIQITYTLLLGAIGLEFVGFVRLICSDWTIAKIATSEEKHGRSLIKGSIFIKYLLKFKSESSPFALHILYARWSNSIFQYNFLDTRLRKCPKWIEKLLGLIYLGEFYDDWKFGRVEQYSEKLGELIFYELKRKASSGSTNEICASRGKWALEHTKSVENCQKLLPFVCDVDYGKSLLLWHIATELCYNTDESTNDHRKTSKVLSDYMLHLMIKQPDMVSAVAGIGQIRFRDTCAEADRFFDETIRDTCAEADRFFDETIFDKRNACRNLLSVPTELNPAEVKGDRSQSALFDACILAKELRKFHDKKWDIVSEVWVELLTYAAIHCQPFMHARQLSKGGELVTLVWLLMVQLGLSEQFQIKVGHVRATAG
ncbi:hypothetical protein NL676_029858 [Syzygium grande]|nr:hypothetical protein NL676_029858 [Syzygium grande]